MSTAFASPPAAFSVLGVLAHPLPQQSSLHCHLCRLLIKDPVTFPCSDSHCHSCLLNYARLHPLSPLKCPKCFLPVEPHSASDSSDVTRVVDSYRNRALASLLSVVVRCKAACSEQYSQKSAVVASDIEKIYLQAPTGSCAKTVDINALFDKKSPDTTTSAPIQVSLSQLFPGSDQKPTNRKPEPALPSESLSPPSMRAANSKENTNSGQQRRFASPPSRIQLEPTTPLKTSTHGGHAAPKTTPTPRSRKYPGVSRGGSRETGAYDGHNRRNRHGRDFVDDLWDPVNRDLPDEDFSAMSFTTTDFHRDRRGGLDFDQ